MHDDEPCTGFFIYPVLDSPTTTIYISVYMRWASRCMCWDGNSGSWREWGENRQEKAFWVLWRGWARNNRSGIGDGGALLNVSPLVRFFKAHVLGFYLRMEDMSLPQSDSEWTELFTGPFRTHHLTECGIRAELSLASAEPYLLVG
jgi:hypothetical protein